MSTPDVAPPVGRKARTRQLVLDAAGELFAAQGIERTSVEQVAERASVSVGTLYFHFGSKEALALAFIESALDSIERLMADVARGESPIERVMLAGDAYLQFAIEFPVACRFGTLRAMQPELRGPHDAIGKGLRNRVQQILMTVAGDVKAAMDAGEIRREPIADLMIFLWSSWNGMVTMMVRQDKLAIPPEAAKRSLALGRSLLLESLRP
ncbi:MAG: TetR/AcrR family transcriptional regulator [Solirubrobacteraceae bacterium]|nr:TetR/AcrR family transcriptional regulator [Patulibacter sp.]